MRKAQTGINAAVLVAIISAFIIVYIIFLPQTEKEKFLLNKSKAEADEEEEDRILLREFPGTLTKASGVEDEKTLPNIFLIETTNAKELAKLNPFIIRSSIFGTKSKADEFTLDDPVNTDNAVLTFASKKHKGVLSIKLNNNLIYENEIAAENIEPIGLDSNLLTKRNKLEFEVSKVGLKFWSANEYNLDNIRVIGDITDKSRQESQNTFTLKDTEVTNIDEAVLKFIPYCKGAGTVGTLDILVNGKKIFSAVPVCDDPYRQVIPTGLLREGDNNIVFRTNKGSYSVEQVVLNFNFKEAKTKTYFFEVNKTQFRDINQSDKDVILSLKFADDVEDKDLRLDVNGHFSLVDERKAGFSKKINEDVIQGNNFVRLTPLVDDVDVVELKVELVER